MILFSWDGTPYWATSRVLQRAELPQLERLVSEGAWAEGMVSSFPTKTAAAHAMLWTGRYGHQNGITANSLLLHPAAEHSRLETRSGFFSDGLEAEPLWVTTARAGLRTYIFHATQSYPFAAAERWAPAEALGDLQMIYGYTRASMSPRVHSERTSPMTEPADWAVAEARGATSREVTLTLGDDRWWGLFFDDPEDPIVGLDTLGLTSSKETAAFEIVLKAGIDAAPSKAVAVSSDGSTLHPTLRLFDLAPQGESYMLYLSSAKALVASSETLPGAAGLATEPYAGNGGGGAYESGELGTTIPNGGDGTAEDRFLVTLADLVDQLRAQAQRVLDPGDYRFVILYSPVLDDANHTWAGYLDPAMPGHDPALAERLWPKLAAAYRLHEGFLEDVLGAAERDQANVLLVSDHGMAGINRLLNVNVVLERAGLLTRTADDTIDLERTRALQLPVADTSIAINTTDRAGGIVPPSERQAVLDEVRTVLEALRDPLTGERLITGLYEPATAGELQPGGASAGDLFLDLAPGYYLSDRLGSNEVITTDEPSGNHGFLPTRADMLAICGAWGPDIPRGMRWSRVRAIDIAPTVLRLLGIEPAADLPGRSLVDDTGSHLPEP